MHTVRSGETITRIAKKYGISKNDLADANNISTRSKLYTGVQLRIPVLTNINVDDFSDNTDTQIAQDNSSDNNSDGIGSHYGNLNSELTEDNEDSESKIVETIVGEEIASLDTDDNLSDESKTSSSLIPEVV